MKHRLEHLTFKYDLGSRADEQKEREKKMTLYNVHIVNCLCI